MRASKRSRADRDAWISSTVDVTCIHPFPSEAGAIVGLGGCSGGVARVGFRPDGSAFVAWQHGLPGCEHVVALASRDTDRACLALQSGGAVALINGADGAASPDDAVMPGGATGGAMRGAKKSE